MRVRVIEDLIKMVEGSEISELSVWRWGWRVRIRKNAPSNNTLAHPSIASHAPLHLEAPPPAPSSSNGDARALKEVPQYAEIRSPMVGTFYRAPSPEAGSFVEVGDRVEKGQVLCSMEAMKLMNEIVREKGGRIRKILVDNSQPVEFNQPLFYIDESDA